MENFLKEACKKAFRLWITEAAEPNNAHPIKSLINDLLTKNIFHTLDEYETCIYAEVAKRLYKNKIAPDDVTKLAKLKLPMLIEISSNNSEHLVKGAIHQYILKEKDENIFQKTIDIILAKYVTLSEMGAETMTNSEKPDPENLKDILEFHQLQDLYTDITLEKYIDKITSVTQEHIDEIKAANKKNKTKEPILPQKTKELFQNIRNGIPKIINDKNKAILLETLLEKISKHRILNNNTEKKKPGRPKRQNNQNDKSQTAIENYFQAQN